MHFKKHKSTHLRFPSCEELFAEPFLFRRDAAEMKFKIELSAHIKKIALHVALCEALRHRLGLAQAQQKVQELKILKMTKKIALLRASSRDEIYYERAHSARLKLWVHTMVAGFLRIRSMLSHREALLHRQKALDLEAAALSFNCLSITFSPSNPSLYCSCKPRWD